jgi:exonuclease VII small subunit
MNNQDQRPVYMGTFSKYMKSFEHKVSAVENDTMNLEQRLRIYKNKMDDYQLTNNRILLVMGIVNVSMIAIYLLSIFN